MEGRWSLDDTPVFTRMAVMKRIIPILLTVWFVVAGARAGAADWTSWRGPHQNGVSPETDLPDTFAIKGGPKSNLIWKADYGCRSTPIVMNGYVYLINDAEEGVKEQERVMCLNADTGDKVWEKRFNVFHTSIVSSRVGWTNVLGDPATNKVYAHGVQGLLYCFDGKDGKVLWSHSLTEEYGRISGYGGRVVSPVLDGDLVIVGMLQASWGEFARGGIRFAAFDKKTGDVVWWGDTMLPPKDTYYSIPVFATINGERLMITGGGDGGVHAFKARTGEKVWSYLIGAGAVNCSPVVEGNLVYIGHGEGNLGTSVEGRVICLDAGKVEDGKPAVVWNKPGIKARYASPILHDGKLYIADVTANLYCLDAKDGKELWSFEYGTDSKGSPVWADGKIYVGAVNSTFSILKPSDKGCEELHRQKFKRDQKGTIEINGSPAVANGRVYFSTSEAVYCIGKKDAKAAPAVKVENKEEKPGADAKPTHLQVYPADVALHPGGSATFKARLFDDKGRFLKEVPAKWSPAPMRTPPPPPGSKPPSEAPASPPALKGTIGEDGALKVDDKTPVQFGAVVAEAEGLMGYARVRIAPTLPNIPDFSKVPEGRSPAGWVNAPGKFAMRKTADGNVLVKTADNASPLVCRANAYIGMPDLSDYTIESDVRGADGNHQRVVLGSWEDKPRVDERLDFPWKPDTWYRLKLMVDVQDDKVVIRGKAWPKGEKEPAKWTIEFEDPTPNTEGSPGLYGYALGILPGAIGTEIQYANVSITPNKKK